MTTRTRWTTGILGAVLALGTSVGESLAIVPLDGGTPMVSPRLINLGPGDQYDPHVSGDIVSYTADSNIRYYDFFSGADAQVPAAVDDVDHLSDVSFGKIVLTRDKASGASAIMVYDIVAGTTTEIDPKPLPARTQPAIGGGTVAFIDLASTGHGELLVSRMGAASLQVTMDTRIDQRPAVSPSGDLVVWESCASSTSNCDVHQGSWNGSSWAVAPLTANSESEANPDSDGVFVVYDATRAGERDIFWQAVGGGAEQRLELQGEQRNPSVSGGFILFESVAIGETKADLWIYSIETNRMFRITSTPVEETLCDVAALSGATLHVVWSAGDADARDIIGATVELPACAASPEICDGFDNDCDGSVDEGIPIPSSHPVILATKLGPGGELQLHWSAASDATGYDIVRGGLATLRSSGGDFTISFDTCLGNDASPLQSQDATTPSAGAGFWYLVRPVSTCSPEPGTYDDEKPPQLGSRDNELDAAPGTCPYG